MRSWGSPYSTKPCTVGSQRGCRLYSAATPGSKGLFTVLSLSKSCFHPINLVTVGLICPGTHGTLSSLCFPQETLICPSLSQQHSSSSEGCVPAPRKVFQPQEMCPIPKKSVPSPKARLEEKLFPNPALGNLEILQHNPRLSPYPKPFPGGVFPPII